jgi:hypothetical protein
MARLHFSCGCRVESAALLLATALEADDDEERDDAREDHR